MDIGQIVAQLNQAVCETSRSQIHKCATSFFWIKEKFPCQWKESLIIPACQRVMVKGFVVNTEAHHCSKLRIKSYPTFFRG